MQTAIQRVGSDTANTFKSWFSDSYKKFKNQIDINLENSKQREVEMNANDVLLEKNLLAFLNDLINDFKQGYIDIKKALVSQEIFDEFSKNGALSKEQFQQAIMGYLEQNSSYSQMYKDTIKEAMLNPTKENIAINLFSEKMKSIFDRLESGEISKDNLLSDNSTSLNSEDILNSKDMFKSGFDSFKKEEVGEIAKNVIKKVIAK
nr:hypothetical protein [Campylobacter sp.]